MATYFVSDLHLFDVANAHVFGDGVEAVLERWLGELEHTARLVLVGDILDLTAMEIPRGLAAFFAALGVPDQPVPQRRSLEEKVARLRAAHPRFFAALGRFSETHETTFVLGNHDAQLAEEAHPERLTGLDAVRFAPSWSGVERDRTITAIHGHGWDEANRTDDGWRNRGAGFTSAMMHGALPYLRRVLAPQGRDVDRLAVLRPEERVIPVLRRWLTPGAYERFFDAYFELLAANGVVPGFATYFLTPDYVRARLREDESLWERVAEHGLEVLEGVETLPGRPPPPDVLVAGHTHVLDWAEHTGRRARRIYCNLGTWTRQFLSAFDRGATLLPLLRVGDDDACEVAATLTDLASGDVLNRAEL